MPSRDLVPAPVPLSPHVMTLPSVPLDNLTPAPVDPPLPQCPCTSVYPIYHKDVTEQTESFPVIQM
jgi:hypothetical protein